MTSHVKKQLITVHKREISFVVIKRRLTRWWTDRCSRGVQARRGERGRVVHENSSKTGGFEEALDRRG